VKRSCILLTLLAAGTFSLAFAQGPVYRDQYGNPRYGERRYRGGYRDYDRPAPDRGNGVERVLADLSRAGSRGRMDHGEWKHLDKARRDLEKFQEKWYRGKFDRGKLDAAIGHLDRVAGSYRVDPRTRDLVSRNLYELREFRARGGYRRPY
jgi:hypothetical protein